MSSNFWRSEKKRSSQLGTQGRILRSGAEFQNQSAICPPSATKLTHADWAHVARISILSQRMIRNQYLCTPFSSEAAFRTHFER